MARKIKNRIVPEDNNSSFNSGNGNFSPDLDKNNPLFTKQKNADGTDALVEQMNQLLPGVLPKDEGSSIEVSADLRGTDEDGNVLEPLSDEEVIAILNVREPRARTFIQDEISIRAAESNEFYLAQPVGRLSPPETPGRSNYVDSSVADTINWLLPPLLDVFCGTENVVNFVARNQAQEKSAEMTTCMVNHALQTQPEGWFKIARTWIHDALMAPAGILKVYWEPDLTPKTTYYRGLTDLQYSLLVLEAEAGEFALTKHKQYQNPNFQPLTMLQHGLAMATGQAPAITPQLQQGIQQGAALPQIAANVQVDPTNPTISESLHDVVVAKLPDHNKNSRGRVKVVNVPLEEFYFDPLARSVYDATYSAHARRMTISDLRAMGFEADVLDEISNTQFDPEMSRTFLTRTQLQGAYAYSYFNNNVDPSMREVIVVESYIKMDYMQTGVAEWRKVIRCGNTILLNEPCDGNPFLFLNANPLPHLAFGVSVAEQAQNAQLNQTQLMRALIDNVNLGANAQMYVVDGEVNIDDAMDSRPGALIRVKTPESIGVIQSGSGDTGGVTSLLEILDTMKQERTGVQKLTQGSDADIVNETATGYQAMTERSEQRIKLMAREFAENGFKPLALRVQKLLAQYQDEYMQIRLNGQTVEADPMDAANQYDVDVKVGLGTGDKSRTVAGLNQVLQMQMQAISTASGLSNLNLVHNTIEKLVKAMGFPSPEEFFCPPPAPMPQPPQPQLSPDMQAKIQIEQQSVQAEASRQQRQAELDAMRIRAQAQNDNQQSELAHQREMAKLQMEHNMEREKLYIQAAIQREQAALQAMVSPEQEGAMFNETFESTAKTLDSALTTINMKASGDYDKFLNAVVNAPEPTTPDQTGSQQ
ncbi:portal protein [Burkholderia vietnamiensis]|uniref:portal protein n=1 Tax=Burkholderia vietnamiensis TaxID=60552 RepID=UPI00158B2738|nr:hypothetical protein [Burkholderia vietnamiensis]